MDDVSVYFAPSLLNRNPDGTRFPVVAKADYDALLATHNDNLALSGQRGSKIAELQGQIDTLESAYVRAGEREHQLRAELAEVKGREAVPVAWMDEDGCLHTTLESATFRRRPVTPLYTTPPASPDVEGLVKALEEVQAYASRKLDDDLFDVIDTALSAWRQAQGDKA